MFVYSANQSYKICLLTVAGIPVNIKTNNAGVQCIIRSIFDRKQMEVLVLTRTSKNNGNLIAENEILFT